MSWPTVELGDLADVYAGAGFPKQYQGQTEGDFPFAKVGDISRAKATEGKTITEAENYVTESVRAELNAKVFPAGSIVFAKIGEAIRKNNRCVTTKPMVFDNNVMGLKFNEARIANDYAFRFLDSIDFYELSNSTTVPSIRKSDMERIKIPLPPLEEQRRIAGILDQADALRRLRTRALDKLNTLGQAIFHEMFGDVPERNIQKLSQVADLINGDRSSNYPSGDDLKEDGVLFLSTKNIRDWRLDLSKVQYITEEKFSSLTRGKLQHGDLVITLRGTLGQAAIFDCKFETGFINAQMMIIRPKSGIFPQYLLDFLALDRTQHELSKGQSGSAVKQLTAKQVGELPIVVPTEAEQLEYVNRIGVHQTARSALIEQSDHFEALFASLQHRAFRGEL